jgi:predicted transcriptional regulator
MESSTSQTKPAMFNVYLLNTLEKGAAFDRKNQKETKFAITSEGSKIDAKAYHKLSLISREVK